MSVTITKKGQVSQVKIEGELTIFNAQETLEALRGKALSAKKTEMDLSEVTEIDAAGLQILIALKQLANAKAHTLNIVAHSQAVAELFHLSDLARLFDDPMVIQYQAN